MNIYNVKLIQKIIRTKLATSFRLIPEIDFLPGQFMQILFDENDEFNAEMNKFISFSCAPGKNYIEFTKKLSESNFSKKLMALEQGDTFKIKAPLGETVYYDNQKKIAFLIGGIGITPAISIIEHIFVNNINTNVILLYSNRTVDDIAFKPELDKWNAVENINVFYRVGEGKTDANTSIGKIDDDFVKSIISDLKSTTFYSFGPPRMVDAMVDLCNRIGCEKIITETFMGY